MLIDYWMLRVPFKSVACTVVFFPHTILQKLYLPEIWYIDNKAISSRSVAGPFPWVMPGVILFLVLAPFLG